MESMTGSNFFLALSQTFCFFLFFLVLCLDFHNDFCNKWVRQPKLDRRIDLLETINAQNESENFSCFRVIFEMIFSGFGFHLFWSFFVAIHRYDCSF